MADITFMALHGSLGENGKLQSAFDILGIRYTGPNSLGCALSMDKGVTKEIFQAQGVPTPAGTHLFRKDKDCTLDELGFHLPVVVNLVPADPASAYTSYIQMRNIVMPSKHHLKKKTK